MPKYESEIKTFLDMKKLKEFIICKPTQQESLKGSLSSGRKVISDKNMNIDKGMKNT